MKKNLLPQAQDMTHLEPVFVPGLGGKSDGARWWWRLHGGCCMVVVVVRSLSVSLLVSKSKKEKKKMYVGLET